MASRVSTIERVVLECSFKPFSAFDADSIERTVRELFEQWMPLLATAESAAVLLWIADGSEILEWAGAESDPVEWARWVGFNNTAADPYGHNVTPEMTATPYRPNAPDLDYAGIRRVVETLKRVGSEIAGIPVTVGATFDAGPEFARSDFKYGRHSEILATGESAGIGRVIRMVRPWSRLNADSRPYAAFPDGITQDTGFGTFLGRQAQSYLDAMGFDYLWLSNGFGFSSFSWTALGETFDGEAFHGDRVAQLGEDIRRFWLELDAELTLPIEVRGTNLTAGMDVGSDAVPALWIYESGIIRKPPPNSPWGPLNRDFGIELTGYLSRIATLPGEGFPFRFYANDPWFWQNPWWDFYNREPFDIYLPLSVSRIDARGEVGTATDIEILGVDTQGGVLDPRAGAEISAAINRAREAVPDEAGPLVWLYPFREYHEAMAADPHGIGAAYFEDWFLTGAVNAGAPINTVVSTDDIAGAAAAGALDGRVVLTPASALGAAHAAELERLLDRGIDVVVYGAVPPVAEVQDLLNIDVSSEGIDGEVTIVDARGERPLMHVAALSNGPIGESVRDPQKGTVVLALVTDGVRAYPYVALNTTRPGRLVWVRGSSTFDAVPYNEHALRTPVTFRGTRFIDPSAELVSALAALGYAFDFDAAPDAQVAVQTLHRSDGALWLDGYLADTTIESRYALPEGVPILTHSECRIENGVGAYRFGTTVHKECRLIVAQERGTIVCRELAPFPYGTARLLQLNGLSDATVTVLLPATHGAVWTISQGARRDVTDLVTGGRLVVTGIDGELTVGWAKG